MQGGHSYLRDIILFINNQMSHLIRLFPNYTYFVVFFNYFKRLELVIFMCHVDGEKGALPYDYPLHVANSSGLSNQGETLAHFKNHL